jgi:hypothetical protein
MATIIEIQDSKLQSLSEYAEKVLRYGGKLMQCLEEVEGKSKYHEYRGVSYRHGDKERWDEEQYRGRYY